MLHATHNGVAADHAGRGIIIVLEDGGETITSKTVSTLKFYAARGLHATHDRTPCPDNHKHNMASAEQLLVCNKYKTKKCAKPVLPQGRLNGQHPPPPPPGQSESFHVPNARADLPGLGAIPNYDCLPQYNGGGYMAVLHNYTGPSEPVRLLSSSPDQLVDHHQCMLTAEKDHDVCPLYHTQTTV